MASDLKGIKWGYLKLTHLCRRSHTGAVLVAGPALPYASWPLPSAGPPHETASLQMPPGHLPVTRAGLRGGKNDCQCATELGLPELLLPSCPELIE